MRLVRLEAKDFAQHGDLDLDLGTIDQAVIVGENGAGKSTLMDAVVWCLYGRGTERSKSTDELIRDERLGMWVRTTWDRDGIEVIVQRSRSTETKAGESSLNLWYDGSSETRHTIGESQEMVDAWFSLNRDQLLAGPFMEQGQQDRLMRLDPGPRKTLFASLCGADRFEAAHLHVKQLISSLSVDIARIEGQIPPVREKVDEELEVRRNRDEAAKSRDTAAAAVTEMADRLEEARLEAQSLRDQALRAEELSREIDRLLHVEVDFKREIEGFAKAKAKAESIIATHIDPPVYEDVPPELDPDHQKALDRQAQAVKSYRIAMENRKVSLRIHEEAIAKAEVEGLCDTCPYRTVTGPDSQLEEDRSFIATAEAYLEEHTGDEEAALAYYGQLKTRERERELIQAQNAYRKERFENALAERESASGIAIEARYAIETREQWRKDNNEKIKELQAERLRLIQSDDRARELAEEMTKDVEALNMARQMLATAERTLAWGDAAMLQVAEAKRKLEELDREWTRLMAEMDAHKLVERMLHRDGLPTMIVEATVPLVEQRANELLERMPGDMSVALITQKQTKSGTWRDTLDIEVSEAGRPRSYGMLSGAERFRVDLALRLGLSAVLLHQSGTKFETLWLDEPFAAQDKRALESLLQSVAAVADEFGLTLVVTHQPEVAERFPVRIEVTADDLGGAKVEVAA